MQDFLRRAAAATPGKLAATMADGSATLSYAELDDLADRMAAVFQSFGAAAGSTIALLHDNHIQVLGWWWGARRAGLYYAPLAASLTAGELGYIVRDCGAVAVIAAAGLRAQAADLQAALADPAIFFLVGGAGTGPVGSLNRRLADTAGSPLRAVALAGRELLYSSGTSGRPKGIRRPLTPIAQAVALPDLEVRIRALFRIDGQTTYLSVAPLYHATGRFLLRVVEQGGTVVVMPRFDAEAALAAIERHRVTHTQWVPTMFARLLALPEAVRHRYDLSSMRTALHAAAPCPIPVKRAMIGWWGPIIDEYYGGTENAGVTFITAPEWLERPGSVGRSIGGAIHILDDDGGERSTGEIGLICFDGGVPFDYLNDLGGAAATRPATYGDFGHIDEAGYLYLSDRRSDLIIVGGVNVYSSEIERVLATHPEVEEPAVIGVADREYGQQVKAVIRLRRGAEPTGALVAELTELCRRSLSRIKCPRSFDFVDELPRNENGKLLKRVLRDRYAASPSASVAT